MSPLADLSTLPPVPVQAGGDPQALRSELLWHITEAMAAQPRSRQRRIGPSEIGHPCGKCLARKLAGLVENQWKGAPWLPYIGTAVHEKLADDFVAANVRWRETTGENATRWLVETTVSVGEISGVDITGSADLLDRCTLTNIDHKIVGEKSLKKYRLNGPGPQYRVQGHLYARGWHRRGIPVQTVAILFLPRGGELEHAHLWAEPYDEQIALDALFRAQTIADLVDAVGLDAAVQALPADDGCYSCARYWGAELPQTPPATVGGQPNPTAA